MLTAEQKVSATAQYLAEIVQANPPMHILEACCDNLKDECEQLEQEMRRGNKEKV